jgi:hypothetical protein
MPDVGMPPSSRQTHTSTQEWQSFEIRMRRRRAERCLLRAEVALDAGFEDDARLALDEARRLDWQTPDFDSLKARLVQRRAAQAAERNGRRRRVYIAAALLAVMAAGGALVLQYEGAAPETSARANTLPAPPQPVVQPVSAPVADPPAAPTGGPPAVEQPSVVSDSPVQPVTTERQREEERIVTDRGDRRPEPAASERGSPTQDRREPATDPKLQATNSTPRVPPDAIRADMGALPAVAVPTSSPAAPRPAPTSTSLMGNPLEPIRTPPSAARVPDLPPAPVTTPPPAPTTTAPAPSTTSAAPPDDAGVRAALAQYESAYSSLNAAAARAVWPGVDARSLERAFDSLESQRVALGKCSVSMNGTRAQATCQGTATWTPKVGGGTNTSPRTWRFDLANTGGAWKITRADAR